MKETWKKTQTQFAAFCAECVTKQRRVHVKSSVVSWSVSRCFLHLFPFPSMFFLCRWSPSSEKQKTSSVHQKNIVLVALVRNCKAFFRTIVPREYTTSRKSKKLDDRSPEGRRCPQVHGSTETLAKNLHVQDAPLENGKRNTIFLRPVNLGQLRKPATYRWALCCSTTK